MSKNMSSPAFLGEIRINVKAELIKVDPATGIVTLAIEATPIDRDLQRAMEKTFPHCYAEIDAMCQREAMIASITTEGTLSSELS